MKSFKEKFKNFERIKFKYSKFWKNMKKSKDENLKEDWKP
jgi:hypothetical protein